MDKIAIEKKSRELLGQIIDNQDKIWGDTPPQTLKAMIKPELGAFVLGLNLSLEETLGRFGMKGDKFEVAGTLDRNKKHIRISRRFPPIVKRFTAAHELGHYLLHVSDTEVMHRDRPIKGLNGSKTHRSPKEREADYFAACFLLPRKVLRSVFQKTFETNLPFVFDHDAAFYLSKGDHDSLLYAADNSLEREMTLATAESYKGKHFNSLAKQFGVSPTTMAIRLSELELIRT